MDLLRHVVEVYGYDVFLCHNILSLSYLLLKDKKCGQIKKSTTLYWILLTLRTHFQSCHLLTHLHPSSEYLLLCRDTRGWRLSQLTLARARGRGTPWKCHHNVYHRADTIGGEPFTPADTLQFPIPLTCMSSDCGRKHRKASNCLLDSNWGFPDCELKALTTEPPCSLTSHPFWPKVVWN